MTEAASKNAGEINCQLCEYVMSMVKEQLDDPETEADLLAQAAQVDLCWHGIMLPDCV